MEVVEEKVHATLSNVKVLLSLALFCIIEEPICNYHTCNHKFSLNDLGTRVCKCNHPQNHSIGTNTFFAR